MQKLLPALLLYTALAVAAGAKTIESVDVPEKKTVEGRELVLMEQVFGP